MTEVLSNNPFNLDKEFYALDSSVIFEKIITDPKKGLTSQEATKRLEQFGPNEIPKVKKSIWTALLAPLLNWLIAIYFFSAGAMFILGDAVRTIPTFIIVGTNCIVAIVQQFRAEKQLSALRKLAATTSTVVRDGIEVEIPTNQVVIGDIIKLSQGDKIPADLRIIEGHNLELDEASLTGESESVKKDNKGNTINEDKGLPLQDQRNMLFLGTFISKGNGWGVTVKTGKDTEIGKISTRLEESSTGDIPLRRKLNNFAKYLATMVVIILIISVIQKLSVRIQNDELTWALFKYDLTNSIDLGMKVMPINLTLLTTIVLLTGTLAMANLGVIVREVSRMESLGRVSVICSDKTGTLTQNQMTVKKIWTLDYVYDVTGEGYAPEGEIIAKIPQTLPNHINPPPEPYPVPNTILDLLVKSAILNNNASIQKAEYKTASKANKIVERWQAKGLPTEASLITLGQKYQINEAELKSQYKFVHEYSFESAVKRMSRLYSNAQNNYIFTKGATEWMLPLMNQVQIGNNVVPINETIRDYILMKMQEYAEMGFRVLSIAYKMLPTLPTDLEDKREQMEKDLTYLGFVVIMDPPRPGVKEAVEECHNAGIKVVMITGDSASTAQAIAKDLTIYREGDLVKEGKDIAKMDMEQLPDVSVFARVSPEHKEIIVDNYQKKFNKVVAMTGDGVNDALALNMSDAGIAMGITGTDVAKEAANLVITDDSFATIEVGVREGRGLFTKIRTIIYFFICVSIMEAIILFGSSVVMDIDSQMWGYWQLNVIYLGAHFFPPLGFTFGSISKNIMKEKPRDSAEIITKEIAKVMFVHILIMGLAITLTYYLAYNSYIGINATNLSGITENDMVRYYIDYSTVEQIPDPNTLVIVFKNAQLKAQSMAFVVLFICESLFMPFQIRRLNESIKDSIKDIKLVELIFYLTGLIVLFIIMYNPGMQRAIMNVDPTKSFDLAIMALSFGDWMICIALCLPVIIIVELLRAYKRKKNIYF